jgi:hypothetical protein
MEIFMNRLLCATLLLGVSAPAWAADEMARVVSATPVTQQVGVERQACATYATPGVPPQCSTQTVYESRTVAYNVIYEHSGKQYSVQMPQNPGATMRFTGTGVLVGGAPASAPVPASANVSAPVAAVSPISVVADDPANSDDPTGYPQPYPSPVQVSYAHPGVAYYGSPYYSTYGSYWGPVLGFGFVGGYYGGGRYHGGHRHRR